MRLSDRGSTITTDKNEVLHKWATDFASLYNITQEAQSMFHNTFHKYILDTVRRNERESDQENTRHNQAKIIEKSVL